MKYNTIYIYNIYIYIHNIYIYYFVIIIIIIIIIVITIDSLQKKANRRKSWASFPFYYS